MLRERYLFGDIYTPSLGELGGLRSDIHRLFSCYERDWGHAQSVARNLFYGATDAIQDAGEAILSLEPGFPSGKEILAIYGLLQALFIQQDAVLQLEAAVLYGTLSNKRGWKQMDLELQKIRTLRNRVSGHPSHAKDAGGTASIPLVRSPYHLEAAIYGLPEGSDDERFPKFHIGNLIERNARGLSSILKEAYVKLGDEAHARQAMWARPA
ncbi:hypothetical protein [Caulobacter radicis]|uniref:hypothetical protein n=1 Tax=Caulobacter radicis TaxID=2172650 RepID=UPI001403072A|nr:hypothetical protein [Caulobacter radicis]